MSNSTFRQMWANLGGNPDALNRLHLTGDGTALPSSFQVGIAAQVSIAVAGLAAAERFRRATSTDQTVTVDRLAAAIECRSERLITIAGKPLPELWDTIAGAYTCGDGRTVRLHTNFAHHREGVLRLLGCAGERLSVTQALSGWQADEFEQAATERGLVVAMMRTFAEWDAHPHATVVRARPLVEITRIGDGPPPNASPTRHPLDDLRILEMTRIIAGPVAGRTLAAHGANVLRVIGPQVPTIEVLDVDTGRGKRSAHVDLTTEPGREAMRMLVAGADVMLQSYRPGALASRSLSPSDLARQKPGIIVGSLSAYGHDGPWGEKRGFDSLVQTATGFNAAEAEAAGVTSAKPLPMQILDHASGHLLAAGVIMARMRAETEGGSWHVAVSLARTAEWLRSLGRVADGLATPEPDAATVARHLEKFPSATGAHTWTRHAAILSATPASWSSVARPYGTDRPAW